MHPTYYSPMGNHGWFGGSDAENTAYNGNINAMNFPNDAHQIIT